MTVTAVDKINECMTCQPVARQNIGLSTDWIRQEYWGLAVWQWLVLGGGTLVVLYLLARGGKHARR